MRRILLLLSLFIGAATAQLSAQALTTKTEKGNSTPTVHKVNEAVGVTGIPAAIVESTEPNVNQVNVNQANVVIENNKAVITNEKSNSPMEIISQEDFNSAGEEKQKYILAHPELYQIKSK